MALRDYAEKELKPGDVILNGQGRLFTLLETEPTLAKEGIARCAESPGMVRAYHCFLVDGNMPKDIRERRAIYDRLCLKIREKVRAMMVEKRQVADRTLREMGIRQ